MSLRHLTEVDLCLFWGCPNTESQTNWIYRQKKMQMLTIDVISSIQGLKEVGLRHRGSCWLFLAFKSQHHNCLHETLPSWTRVARNRHLGAEVPLSFDDVAVEHAGEVSHEHSWKTYITVATVFINILLSLNNAEIIWQIPVICCKINNNTRRALNLTDLDLHINYSYMVTKSRVSATISGATGATQKTEYLA